MLRVDLDAAPELSLLLEPASVDVLEDCFLLEAPGSDYWLTAIVVPMRCDLQARYLLLAGITHPVGPLLSGYTYGGPERITMSTLRCPICGKDIELVGQKELTEEYGLGPNPVAHQRQLGVFPEPVLSFGNRNMWLRGDIERYVEERRRERIAKLIEDFSATLESLPESERGDAIKMLTDGDGARKGRTNPRHTT